MDVFFLIFGVGVLFAGLGRLAWPRSQPEPQGKKVQQAKSGDFEYLNFEFAEALDELSIAEQRSRALAESAQRAREELEALRSVTEPGAPQRAGGEGAAAR